MAATTPHLLAAPSPAPVPGSPSHSAFDYADIFTLPFPPPEPDQSLTPEATRQSDAVAWFVVGKILEQQGELESALQTYRKSLDLDPAHYGLAEKVAFEYVRRNNIPEAIAILKDCAAAAPDDARPLVTLAFLYSRYLDKPDLATQYANQALAIQPGNLAIYQRLYETYESQGDRDAAERVLEQAANVKTESPEFWLALGIWLSELQIPLTGANPSPDQIATIQALFEKAAIYAPDDPVVLTAIGDFHARIGQFDKSVEYFLAALEIDEHQLPTREKLTQAYLHLEQTDQAIEQLDAIIRINPLFQAGYALLGQLHEDQGNLRRAAMAYEQSLLLNPNQIDGYERLAEIYLTNDPADPTKALDATKAIELLAEGIRRFEFALRLHVMYAIALLADQQYEAAFHAFEAADSLFEQEPGTTQTPHFYFQHGAAAERAKQYERATDRFQRAIALDPSFHQALNYLGYMWIDRNENLQEAGDLIRQALQYDPENAAYLDSLGWYYYRRGDFDKALEYLLQAFQNDGSNDPEICDHIGDTYSQLGQKDKAIQFWQKALKHEDAANRVDVPTIQDKIQTTQKLLTQLQEESRQPPAEPQP